MEPVTSLPLMWLGAYIALLVLTLAPWVGLSWLLDRRDRRRARLREAVLRSITSEDVRRRIRIDVRSALLSRGGVVTVDMSACPREEIWEVVTRLSHGLPPRVGVAVLGSIEGQGIAVFRLEPPRRRPLQQPAPASAPGR